VAGVSDLTLLRLNGARKGALSHRAGITGQRITGAASSMSNVDTSMNAAEDAPLIFTDSAANKVRQLIEEEGNPDLKLRVFISGGGCSGFQYGFTFEESEQDGDTRIDKAGVTLLVDPMSIQYLMGAEIDYTEGLEGAQFVIRNPNATTTCGCGSSFSV
jgi:iron-sulfur cluster insertion protein